MVVMYGEASESEPEQGFGLLERTIFYYTNMVVPLIITRTRAMRYITNDITMQTHAA